VHWLKVGRKVMASVNPAVLYLAQEWKNSGVEEGDTLLIHSNIKRTLVKMRRQGVKLMPEHILQIFIEALGKDGTLILPLFNFEFPESKFFDIRSTPSQMGALTEIGRIYPGSVRTGHPIYSFVAIGKNADLFRDLDNESGYGSDSPFALLKSLDGKIGSLDLEDQNSMTYYHYVEEMHNVPYRYFKEFSGTYIDRNGISTNRTYKLFVRDIEHDVRTHVNPAGELMWEQGFYSGDRPGIGSGLRIVGAEKMYDFVSQIIVSGNAEGTLFRYGDET
jgi:aminoglycoside N3'-acetyltransferase